LRRLEWHVFQSYCLLQAMGASVRTTRQH